MTNDNPKCSHYIGKSPFGGFAWKENEYEILNTSDQVCPICPKPLPSEPKCPECNGTKKMVILGGEIIDCNCTRIIPSKQFIMPNQEIHPCFSGCKQCDDTRFCSCECHQPSGVSICKPYEPKCEPMLPDVCVGCYSKPCICKPVEPSVEEKIESIIHNCLTAEYLQQSEELRRMHRYYHARLLDNAKPQMIKLIAEALRNERNRK